ncbi:BTB/POZ domain-containing protein [Sesamum alatum]|uniref:BTB/POZ domain-containing protein n=1 Tax=Sesamum alatum TaxID=300844 RepID=A0AAE2CFV0_9LAMI|nr:BTB/POZ domain-containing protein [Sesamum alatum]
MDACFEFDLQVDVNGEEVFVLDTRIISSYSGKINKLLSKSKDGLGRRLKVIFHDFPGGAANFELIIRFCYDNGKVNINPGNISNLSVAAHFMEMNKFVAGTENLCEQTEKSLEEIKYWTWSELLVALKQCGDLLPEGSSLTILDKFLGSLVGKVVSSCETSPCPSTSSPESYGFRLSCETRSSESLKNSCFRATWWFDDLVALNIRVIKMLIRSMVSRNLDNGIISKFLFYYQKSRFGSAPSPEKVEIIEAIVEMLCSLDTTCVSYKSLFEVLRVGLNLNLSRCCRDKLEGMIGSLLDRATLDNLLLPSPARKTSYLYDVDLVLRFLKSFLGNGVGCVPLSRLKKVVRLMDLYLVEIAPDPHLKPSKFLVVIRAIPDSARDSSDEVYHAVNLYLEVHSGLSEDQKTKICSGLNYEKLSSEEINDLTRNVNFPSQFAAQALILRQRRLESLLQDTDEAVSIDLPPTLSKPAHKGRKGEGSQQIVLYAKKLSLCDESKKLRAHLQGMQWRALELEKFCRRMQIQMTKMMRSRLLSGHGSKSVPKICS